MSQYLTPEPNWTAWTLHPQNSHQCTDLADNNDGLRRIALLQLLSCGYSYKVHACSVQHACILDYYIIALCGELLSSYSNILQCAYTVYIIVFILSQTNMNYLSCCRQFLHPLSCHVMSVLSQWFSRCDISSKEQMRVGQNSLNRILIFAYYMMRQ